MTTDEFVDDTLSKYGYLHESLSARYRSASGGTRATYFMRGVVVKVPLNAYGVEANYHEADWSACHGKGGYIPIAEAFIETWGGLDVLIMEQVKPVSLPYSQMPDWVMSVDCAQVGYDADGVLVAYDL